MSGFDRRTGVFELTPSNVRRWLRDPEVESIEAADWMSVAGELMTRRGLEVLRVTPSYILVRARQSAIWQVLSGMPSLTDFDEPSADSSGYYSATYLGCLVVPKLSPSAFNKRAQSAGLIVREATGWRLTPRGRNFGIPVEYGGKGTRRGQVATVIHWSLEVLDLLELPWPKPPGVTPSKRQE